MEQPRPLRVSPFYARQQELGRVLPGGRRLGAAALVRGERPARRRARPAPRAGRLVGPLLVADRGGRGEGDPREGRALRHDPAAPAGGHRPRRPRLPARHDHQQPRARSPARSPTPCCWTRPAASAPTSPSRGSAPTASRSGANSPADLDWLPRHAPEGVQIRDITSGTCCIGVWGPLARDLVQPLTRDDFSHEGFGYFRAKETYLGHVPVTAHAAELRRRAGLGALHHRRPGAPALGHALGGGPGARRDRGRALRLQQPAAGEGLPRLGHRHDRRARPVRGGGRLRRPPGQGGLHADGARWRPGASRARRLTPLLLDDPASVVLGKEPVYVDGSPAGYVTSAAYGYTLGRCDRVRLAAAVLSAPGASVHIEYFGEKVARDRRRRAALRSEDDPHPPRGTESAQSVLGDDAIHDWRPCPPPTT